MVVFFCADCGKEANTGMKFCGNCGAALHPSSDGVASAQTPTSSPCPSGQELREERYDTTSIKSRGCVGQDSENNYRRQGHWEFFYPNGQKSREGSYVDAHPGGDTDGMGILIDGREGAWVFWYENGQKSGEETYRDGEPEGLTTDWHENGQKSAEWTYRDGEREGLLTTWHENGQKSRETTYLNGTETSVTEWDESGTQTSR